MPSLLKTPALERLRSLLTARDIAGAEDLLASRTWSKYDASHPVFELLRWENQLPAADVVRLLEALARGGWDPRSLVSGSVPYEAGASRAVQEQLSAPFMSRACMTASLARRVAALNKPEHRQAVAQMLEAHGVGPDAGAWREAHGRLDFPLMKFWEHRGHALPPPSDRLTMAMEGSNLHRASLKPDMAAAGRLLDELAAEGWFPSEAHMADAVTDARERNRLVFLAAWLHRHPKAASWPLKTRAEFLEVLWSPASERWGMDAVVLTRRLLEHPEWRDALHAPVVRLPEFLGTPAEGQDWPVWHTLFHPLRQKHGAALAEVVLPHVQEPHDRVGAHTRTEIWAAQGHSPAELEVHPLASFLPHPQTGRWPAASASHHLDAWVRASGGWEKAALEPQGPWPEITARIIKERRSDFIAAWGRALKALSPQARARLTATFEGMTVAEWAAGRDDMAALWRESALHEAGSVSPTSDLRAALLAGSIPRTRAALKRLTAADRASWLAPSDNPLTWVLAHDWGTDGNVRRRVMRLVNDLAAAGAPWPTEPELWNRSVLFNGLKQWSSSPRDLDIKEWASWRQWPACLALQWARSARVELAGKSPDARGVARAVAVLDQAQPGTANKALLVLMQSGLKGPSLPYPVEGTLPYALSVDNLALLVPELVRRVTFPLGFDPRVLQEAWRQNPENTDASLARFWAHDVSAALTALFTADALRQGLPEAPAPSSLHRRRL